MKAWQFYSLGDMRLEEIPLPKAEPGWVVVRVRVVQPSVTEAIIASGMPTIGADRIKAMLAERAPVRLFGHEFCAEVVELGVGVEGLAIGDRVAAKSIVPCGTCFLCRSGRREVCRKGKVIGHQLPGAFAEYAALPAEVLVKLPDSISDSEGASLQPFTSCVPAVADAGIQMGDTVAFIGQGVMGLFCMQIARHSSASLIIGIDVRDQTLRLSKELGADVVIDARKTDAVEAVLQLTNGVGADVVFEAAGGSPAQGLAGSSALDQAIRMVADGGRIVQVAILSGEVRLPSTLRERCLSYICPRGTNRRLLEHSVALLASGRVRIAPLVSHSLNGLDKMPQALEITANKSKYGAIGPAQVVVA